MSLRFRRHVRVPPAPHVTPDIDCIRCGVPGTPHSDDELAALDDAVDRHPGLAFRYAKTKGASSEGRDLQAYILLVGSYPGGLGGGQSPETLDRLPLTDTDRRLVRYLAHVSDRLEFELTGGGDKETSSRPPSAP